MHSVANSRYARIADGRIPPLPGRRPAYPNAAVCKLPMHAYTLRRIITRWRERSSDPQGGYEPASPNAPMSLTRLSLFPYAGDLTNACRSVPGAPSR